MLLTQMALCSNPFRWGLASPSTTAYPLSLRRLNVNLLPLPLPPSSCTYEKALESYFAGVASREEEWLQYRLDNPDASSQSFEETKAIFESNLQRLELSKGIISFDDYPAVGWVWTYTSPTAELTFVPEDPSGEWSYSVTHHSESDNPYLFSGRGQTPKEAMVEQASDWLENCFDI